MNAGVTNIIRNAKRKKELEQLRSIILECDLVEDVKWKQPCYRFNGKNICILGELKDCAVIGFFKGALMKDPKKIMVKPGENTRAARSIKFTSEKEIIRLKSTLREYIYEAVEIEEAGLKVASPKSEDLEIPEELEKKFSKNAALKKAFFGLTPGRQRAYVMYFAGPKQSATRDARIDKYTPQILNGIGLNDEYTSKKK